MNAMNRMQGNAFALCLTNIFRYPDITDIEQNGNGSLNGGDNQNGNGTGDGQQVTGGNTNGAGNQTVSTGTTAKSGKVKTSDNTAGGVYAFLGVLGAAVLALAVGIRKKGKFWQR